MNSPHIDAAEQRDMLQRIMNGDESAFARMLQVYSNTVFSQAMAFLKSTQLAEECTQDIFLHVWHKREHLRDIQNFEGWLITVARNQIFNFMESRLAKPLPVLLPGAEQLDELTPDLQTEARAAYQLLLKGIEALPEKRRQVFKMSRLEGMTHEEIATALQIHKGTVAQYVVLSLNFLKTYLEKHGTDTIVLMIMLRGLP